jgi:hypothetical protein
MLDHLGFDELLLLGLLWLLVVGYGPWLQRQATTSQAYRQPTERAKRSLKEPKPFVGLTQKPLCLVCEHAQEQAEPVRLSLPPLMAAMPGRRRTVPTQHHFCPMSTCRYYGWVGLGNIRSNGHPSGGLWRQLQCTACHKYFLETHGTPLHGRRVPTELLVWAVGALAEGLGIRTYGREAAITPNKLHLIEK